MFMMRDTNLSYFHMEKDDPGIIISKIEPGSKASVSGLKPYEIITSVNDDTISNVETFGKKIKGLANFRLNVKRMAESRVVKIKMDGENSGKGEEETAEKNDK